LVQKHIVPNSPATVEKTESPMGYIDKIQVIFG